jgi:hypothetical protein
MNTVRVVITNKDRKVGAMIKALAVGVSGFQSVAGTIHEFLATNGYYEFRFPSREKALDFRNIVGNYIKNELAQVVQ